MAFDFNNKYIKYKKKYINSKITNIIGGNINLSYYNDIDDIYFTTIKKNNLLIKDDFLNLIPKYNKQFLSYNFYIEKNGDCGKLNQRYFLFTIKNDKFFFYDGHNNNYIFNEKLQNNYCNIIDINKVLYHLNYLKLNKSEYCLYVKIINI